MTGSPEHVAYDSHLEVYQHELTPSIWKTCMLSFMQPLCCLSHGLLGCLGTLHRYT